MDGKLDVIVNEEIALRKRIEHCYEQFKDESRKYPDYNEMGGLEIEDLYVKLAEYLIDADRDEEVGPLLRDASERLGESAASRPPYMIDIADACRYVAVELQERWEGPEIELLFHKAIDIGRMAVEDDPDAILSLACAYGFFGNYLVENDRNDEAIEFLRKAFEIRKNRVGSDSLENIGLAREAEDYAFSLWRSHRKHEALPIFVEAIEAYSKGGWETHSERVQKFVDENYDLGSILGIEITEEGLARAAEKLGITGTIFLNENGEPDVFYSPEEQELMVQTCIEEQLSLQEKSLEEAPEGYISVEDLAEELGVCVEEVMEIAEHLGIEGKQFRRKE